jgi:hypothetical protein
VATIRGDGGGGIFVWINVPSGPMPADDRGIIVHNANNTLGYFKRVYSGPINVRWYGAIMGATDPYPPDIPGTSPPVPYPQPIADVTPYVHRARDSAYATNGSIYFPADFNPNTGVIRPYVGAFVFPASKGEINILGDGQGTVLKSNGTWDEAHVPYPNPVLRLGFRGFNVWRWAKVSNLEINGSYILTGSPLVPDRHSDGVIYDDETLTDSPPQTFPQLAGRWTFEKVTFRDCNKGVFKRYGNIGNAYVECLFDNNNFGYYAQGYNLDIMHVGCEKFIGGHMNGNDLAAVVIRDHTDGTGQIVFDQTVIEGNYGFGIFIEMTGLARMTAGAITLRNVWFEANAGHVAGSPPAWVVHTVTIDNTLYNCTDLYLDGVRSVRMEDSGIGNAKLIESSLSLFNVRNDSAWYVNNIDVDSKSSVVSYEHRNNYQVNENIFVQSLCYDGTGDVGENVSVLTSVWGPLRTIMQGDRRTAISEPFTQADVSYLFVDSGGLSVGTCVGIYGDGVMGINSGVSITCAEMTLGAGEEAQFDNFTFTPAYGKYYFWSIHAFKCPGEDNTISGYIGAAPGQNPMLGQVILKENQWACSYGIKRLNDTTSPPTLTPVGFWLKGGANGGKMRFCHVQVLEFDNLYDATSFMNSRAFAIPSTSCYEGDEG